MLLRIKAAITQKLLRIQALIVLLSFWPVVSYIFVIRLSSALPVKLVWRPCTFSNSKLVIKQGSTGAIASTFNIFIGLFLCLN